jgi:5-methylcytosine-specific restriction endonuclease McrA
VYVRMKYSKTQRAEMETYMDRHNCKRCMSHTDLTIDHIIPVSFLLTQLGATVNETYDWDNFQVLCRPCNTLKAGRFDLSNPKTKELLIKYTNKYCV